MKDIIFNGVIERCVYYASMLCYIDQSISDEMSKEHSFWDLDKILNLKVQRQDVLKAIKNK